MINGFAVASKLQEYLAGQINLDVFREWVLCAHIEVASEKDQSRIDSDAVRLLAGISGRYAEYSDGLVSEDVLRRRIAILLAPRPQSAEALLLDSFYSVPSFPSQPPASPTESSNVSTVTNYLPEDLVVA